MDAGACDRCQQRPRLLPTCGPDGYPGLCAGCAADLGVDAWCDGHQGEAEASLAWAADLPAYVDTVITLWWVATGEVRAPERSATVAHLPPALRYAADAATADGR